MIRASGTRFLEAYVIDIWLMSAKHGVSRRHGNYRKFQEIVYNSDDAVGGVPNGGEGVYSTYRSRIQSQAGGEGRGCLDL